MRIGVTGGSGLLGAGLLSQTHLSGAEMVPLSYKDFHVGKSSANAALLKNLGLSHLIHCAADTNVERNELLPDEAFASNTLLSEWIAKTCSDVGVKMTFISSTGIYGDHDTKPYTEYSDVIPTTIHHRSKYQAEQAVQRLLPDALIIRTGWLFGGDIGKKKNFVVNRIREIRNASEPIRGNAEQFGCPTYVEDVVNRITRSVELGLFGVFNCVNSGTASRYEYVAEIVSSAGLDTPVLPAPASEFRRNAPVAKNEMATNYKYQLLGFEPLPDWRQSLEKYIQTLELNDIR